MKLIRCGAVAAAGAVVLAACGGGGGSGTNGGGTISVVMAAYSAKTQPYWTHLVSQFERKYPKIHVNLRVIDWNTLLPLAKPGIVTAVIFTFIQVWNEFVVAQTIFNDPTRNRETLTVGINAFVGLYQTQYQYLFVASIIGIVPVVILFALIERHIVSGLTAGSIR